MWTTSIVIKEKDIFSFEISSFVTQAVNWKESFNLQITRSFKLHFTIPISDQWSVIFDFFNLIAPVSSCGPLTPDLFLNK